MRVAHKVAIALVVIIVALLALLLPRSGHADQSLKFGDVVVRYGAITTDQLFADVAQRYGIERSPRIGLVNIAVERNSGAAEAAPISAAVTGSVASLTGHGKPIRFRETKDEGGVDYLGEFPLESSGTYVFTIEVTPPGRTQAYTVRFNRDYVLD
jgi:hypothetical protein